jgi:hypothetical protein
MVISPARLVRVSLFAQLTGYSEKAVRNKIDRGDWREGVHFHKAPDGALLMDLEAYYQWATGGTPTK